MKEQFVVDLIEMMLKGGIMAPVHTTVTFQAFNGLEHGMVGMCCAHTYPKGGRAHCAWD